MKAQFIGIHIHHYKDESHHLVQNYVSDRQSYFEAFVVLAMNTVNLIHNACTS